MVETSLNRKRGVCKKQINKFGKFVDELKTRQQDITPEQLTELQERINRIELTFSNFEAIQTEIEEVAKEEEVDTQYEIREDIEEKFYSCMANAKYMLAATNGNIQGNSQQCPDTTAQSNMNGISTQQCVTLPKIDLPKFSGSYFNWLEFRDTFNSLINQNNRISNIDKFHYLKSSLSGDAAQVIKSIKLAASNYDSAWELLCSRYNNTRLLLLNHTRALFNVEQVQKESAIRLRKLIDDVSKHLNALKTLGEPTESWDTLIIYLATSKLESSTLKEWEEFRADLEHPKLDELKKFLTQRANMLETLETRERRFAKPKETKALFASNTDMFCPICSGKHYIQRCEKLLKLKIKERIDEVKRAKLCSNCLKKGHLPNKCKAGKCRLCNEGHNTLLHIDKTDGNKEIYEVTTEENKIKAGFLARAGQILLSTVCIEIFDKGNKICNARAVLDSGSQSSFITEDLCKKCNITISKMKISVSCLNNTETTIRGKCVIDVKPKHESFETKLECLVMKEISGNLPNMSFDKESLNLPVLIRTRLGWIISGPLAIQPTGKIHCNLAGKIDLQEQISKFWKLEECEVKPNKKWTDEERECEESFMQTTNREPNGRFLVKLPLKASFKQLGQSQEQAKRRFFNLERKLNADEALKKEYENFMHEYRKLGHMTKITDNNIGYYIPHHCVLKNDSLTTKLRVVFDASARTTSGKSLNDIMKVDPTIQEDLVSILLRFRQHKYVVSADKAKMYRQVSVATEQRYLQKIFWRDNQHEELDVYQLNTITYGTASASFLAIRSLHQLAEDIKEERPDIAEIIDRDFYVDDFLSGSDAEEEAANICKYVKEALEAGCFPLRKFCSNEPNVLKYVTHKEDEINIINLGTNESTKTLGLIWCPKTDQLSYKSGEANS